MTGMTIGGEGVSFEKQSLSDYQFVHNILTPLKHQTYVKKDKQNARIMSLLKIFYKKDSAEKSRKII